MNKEAKPRNVITALKAPHNKGASMKNMSKKMTKIMRNYHKSLQEENYLGDNVTHE